MQNKQIALSLILIFLITAVTNGQKQVNSPYSRFNIGSIVPIGTYRGLAMGGTGVAMRDNNSIYFVNPSSYGSLDTTSFLLDFGADYSISVLSDGTDKYQSDDMNFGHLLMAFPLAKGWGFATGLVPYSNGYYNISGTLKEGDPGYNPVTGDVTTTHKGEGSLTNFFAGTGVNLNKNFSVGINLSILFGQLSRTNLFEFSDYSNTFSQANTEKLRISGIHLDYGAQYTAKLKKDYFFTAGISFAAAKNYRSDFENFAQRFASYPISAYSPDTLYYTNTTSRDSTRLPSTLRLGIAFGKKDKFVAGIDYISSNWADAKIHGSPSTYLANSKSWLIGLEYIPDKFSNSSFLNRVEYRIGAHTAESYLLINGVQIKEYGISCGFGIRMRNSLSKATTFFDFTRKNGDISKGLFNENFYTIGVSLNLYDRWFEKRRFD